jgi:hypothetical protein
MTLTTPLSFFALPWLQCPLNLNIRIRKEVTCGYARITQLCGVRERRLSQHSVIVAHVT